MRNDNPWHTVSSKIVYKNPWIKIHEDAVIRHDGSKGIYGFLESSDSVLIVAANDNNEVYLIKTFSYPLKIWAWELPGGGGDNEHELAASKRELAEETGITAEEWTLLGKTRVCNGLMTEKMSVFLARDIAQGKKDEADDHGIISDEGFFSLDEIGAMIEKGEIDDGQTLTGLYLFEKWMHRL